MVCCLVRMAGLEPACPLWTSPSQDDASTNCATSALFADFMATLGVAFLNGLIPILRSTLVHVVLEPRYCIPIGCSYKMVRTVGLEPTVTTV